MRVVYPTTIDHIHRGKFQSHWSYLHGDVEDDHGYDIFTCNDLMFEQISRMKTGDFAYCQIIAPDGDHVEAVAICHRSRGDLNDKYPEVLVCLSTDSESITHAIKKAN